MDKGSGTRSGLLWEVERILTELHEDGIQIECLLMENVPQVHGENNKDSWNAWLQRLDQLGYESYWQDLNAKNYGVAQNRDRCFCVSVPKGYYYDFPRPFKLEKRLKDYLEPVVDEKYYLSDELLTYFQDHSKECEEKGLGFRFKTDNGGGIARSVTTLAGNRMDDNFIEDEN